ncbi:MAG: hypothetical protein ACKOXS_07240 [Actinomycetes bacterium]
MLHFKSLNEPSISEWLELFNDQKVKKHMPLADFSVDEDWIQSWIAKKLDSSKETPFEISSIWVEDKFAGWGGIQADGENFEVAIVLRPQYWGFGLEIYCNYINEYKNSGLANPLLVYLPLTRKIDGIKKRLNFIELPNIQISGIEFQVLKVCN